MIKGTAVKL